MGDEPLENLVQMLADAIGDRSGGMTAKVRPPKNFMLNMDFDSWLEQFHTFATLAKVPDDLLKLSLLNLMDAPALAAIQLLKLSDTLSFETFVSKISERFEKCDILEYKRKFGSCSQDPDERLEDFADKIRRLAAKAFPRAEEETIEELMIDSFIKGVILSTELREKLLLEDPSRLIQAVKIAKRLQAVHLAVRGNVVKSTGKSSDGTVCPVGEVEVKRSDEVQSETNKMLTQILNRMEKLETDVKNWRQEGPGPERRFGTDNSDVSAKENQRVSNRSRDLEYRQANRNEIGPQVSRSFRRQGNVHSPRFQRIDYRATESHSCPTNARGFSQHPLN
jgi:hypothetical protein